ncbi:MAG TPA: hypothetical protein DCS29_02630 [Candidatus Magasanikbacteria bacterium]|nr:MAG: hypothetical protein A2479_00130 [Candidatus Magasanikbacteria bacterium RIFOXYC2_FULL_39_8]HAT03653.1 hypothetical protein [Candidatus Magasanikbacteria bacterium]
MFKPNTEESYTPSYNHSTQPDEVETVVGPSVVVEGDFASEGNILVKGTVSGNVQTGKLLTVERGAKILANVKAGNAIISGSVRGNVRVEERLELTESAQVDGDVVCKILVVAAGALLQGKVSMKGIEIQELHPDRKKLSSRNKFKLASDVESEENQ